MTARNEHQLSTPLWESDHPYYCSEQNYFNNECSHDHENWQTFRDDMGTADDDYNLLFRWDWAPYAGEGHDKAKGVQTIHTYWVMQRKGIFAHHQFKATPDEEPEIREFLERKWDKMRALWAPLSGWEKPDADA